MKDVEKIFEAIHEVYELHGKIYLDDNEKSLIKNQLKQLILVNREAEHVAELTKLKKEIKEM